MMKLAHNFEFFEVSTLSIITDLYISLLYNKIFMNFEYGTFDTDNVKVSE